MVTNVMISFAFVQLLMIVLYHFLSYTCQCNTAGLLQTLKYVHLYKIMLQKQY